MAGVFDYINHPDSAEGIVTLNPSFMTGVIFRRLTLLSTNMELLALVNLKLGDGGPLDGDAQQDILDLIGWVNTGTLEDKAAKLALLSSVFGIYEQSKPDNTPWLTEAEARSALATAGVSWT